VQVPLEHTECTATTRCTSLGGTKTPSICQTWYAGGVGAGCDVSADCQNNLFCDHVSNPGKPVCAAAPSSGQACTVGTSNACGSSGAATVQACVCNSVGNGQTSNSGTCQLAYTDTFGTEDNLINNDDSTIPNFGSCIAQNSCGRPEHGLSFGPGGCWDSKCQSQARAVYGNNPDGNSCSCSGASTLVVSFLFVLVLLFLAA